MTTAAVTPAPPARRRAAAAPPVQTTALATTTLDTGLAPIATLQGLKWYAKLSEQEQTAVTDESIGLAQALVEANDGMLHVGERLATLQGILEPHSLFGQFLRNFHFSKRTAYRYIAKFKNAAMLPEPILRLAMARNMAIGGENEIKPFGTYTDAVRKLPAPRNPTQEQAATWLNQVEQVAKETRAASAGAAGSGNFALPEPTDPGTAMKEAFRFVVNRYNQLPNNSRTRANWLKGLFGMLLTKLGVSQAQQIAPVAVPPEYEVGRGRPAVGAAA